MDQCPNGDVFCSLGALCDTCDAAEAAKDDALIREHKDSCRVDGFCYICQCL